MAQKPVIDPRVEAELAEYIGSFFADPYGFVMAAFPWGVEGTPLAKRKGPTKWQTKLLKALGAHIQTNAMLNAAELDYEVWRSAVVSGHGVGKSALVAWMILFLMATRKDTRGVVTANTGNQLETKTWPELGKWHNMMICRHWFNWTATSYYFAAYEDDEKRKNYMVSAQTVSEHNTEAFAGLHNEGRTVFVIFDEASGITSNVWEVVDGAFTDGEPFFLCFGNPTRPDGEFADCFEKNRHMYAYLDHVDSREVEHTNKTALDDIIRKYGEDSDQARIRVYGKFPRQAFDGFISIEDVHDATQRELVPDLAEGVIIGVDVARYGDDDTVISVRQGRDFRNFKQVVLHGLDNVRVADAVQKVADKVRADAIVIESVGPGVGVIDILRDRGYRVIDFHPGSKGPGYETFGNKRAEVWDTARSWIIAGGCMPEDPALVHELTKIKYVIDKKTGKQWMETKEDMKARGLKSPDRADSFVLTFGVKVARKDRAHAKHRNAHAADRNQSITEYNVGAY